MLEFLLLLFFFLYNNINDSRLNVVNAYEEENSVVLVIPAYTDDALIQSLKLSALRSNSIMMPTSTLKRFSLDLADPQAKCIGSESIPMANIEVEDIGKDVGSLEFPTSNPIYFGRKINFCFGLGFGDSEDQPGRIWDVITKIVRNLLMIMIIIIFLFFFIRLAFLIIC